MNNFVRILVVNRGTTLAESILEPFLYLIHQLESETELLEPADCQEENLLEMHDIMADKVFEAVEHEFVEAGLTTTERHHIISMMETRCRFEAFTTYLYIDLEHNNPQLYREFYPVLYLLPDWEILPVF